MKKISVILLSAVLTATMLSACSTNDGKTQSNTTSANSLAAPGDVTDIGFEEADIVIEGDTETVLFDEDGFKLTYTGLITSDSANIASSALGLKVENNSSKEIALFVDYPYVNGLYAFSNATAFPVGCNDVGDFPLYYDAYYGEAQFGGEYPIEKVTSVFAYFTIYDNNDEEDEGITKGILIYPEGKDAAKLYRRELQEGDILIHSDEYVDIIAVGSLYNKENDFYNTPFYLVNKTDKDVNFLTSKDKSFSTEVLEYNSQNYIFTHLPAGQSVYAPYGWFYMGNSALSGESDSFDITCGFHVEYSDNEGEYIVSTDKITFPWKAE